MKKLTAIFVCVFVLAALSGCRAAAASEDGYVRLAIKGTKVNLRPGPSTSGGVVAQMNTGDVFIAEKNPVTSEDDESQWYRIALAADAGSNKISALSEWDSRFKNNVAFVRADFATISPLKEGDMERILPARAVAAAITAEIFIKMCRKDALQQVEAAIKAGADVNAKGYSDYRESVLTPLMSAASNDNPEVLSALIQAGADVNTKSDGGWTALMLAASDNAPEFAKILIRAGADVNAKNDGAWTALMLAARNNRSPEAADALIQAGADVNAKNIYGWTPLMLAAQYNQNPEVSRTLIQAGANANEKDEDGETPLIKAALRNSAEVLGILIQAGADVNAKAHEGWTALLWAAVSNKDPEVSRMLIQAGADVNAKLDGDSWTPGWTPLMCAVRQNSNLEVLIVLIEGGADLNAKNDKGETALDLARASNKPEFVSALEAAAGRR
ncbi:MAG: ankyrin repeat domain-containing protein [Synergistaceae bacterium]|nr:ankyrin repeat domain-containing protein [Synergistaceae bacterium]